MMVRSKKAQPRKYAQVERTPTIPASAYTFPAPINGLVLNENLAQAETGGAIRLDNFICTLTGIKPRGGTKKHATLNGPVKSIFSYKSGSISRMFAATDTQISEVTAPADPDVPSSPQVTGQAVGSYSTVQFGTVGGDYLYAVNGGDDALLYDGTTWTPINDVSSPSITGVPTSSFSHVWNFASRLFFVERGTMSAWFLPIDSIAGEATEFSLAGIFKLGGNLLFGATWSLDAGDGLDDKCVFVSTEGEVAVYEGTNPNSAADWRKVGVYQISKPLGAKAIMQAGGDLIIATEIGAVPLSQAINNDVAALSPRAVSARIAPLWQNRAKLLSAQPWEIIRLPSENIMLVMLPNDPKGSLLVANLQTGAWSRFTGIFPSCLGEFGGNGYFGVGSEIHVLEQTGADNGNPYTCVYLGRFDPLGAPGVQKTVKLARMIFQTSGPLSPKIEVNADFDESISSAPSAKVINNNDSAWDSAIWDNAVWGGSLVSVGEDQWSSVGRTGYVFSPQVQITFGSTDKPSAELVSIDVTYEQGALVA